MKQLYSKSKFFFHLVRYSLFTMIFMVVCYGLKAQDKRITGKVFDSSGETIPGATVLVKGTSLGTITDMDGSFSIDATPGDILLISFVGFQSREVTVSSESSITVRLEVDIQSLEEVVVVGYGTVQKSDLTGSVSSVDVNETKKLATADVARSLQGKVAGVQVTSNSGAPGEGTTIRIRGIGSFASAGPLYVVDGFFTGDISNISPNDIKSMEVLKDASATAIYGSRGSNGVIIITTHKGQTGFNVELNSYAGVQEAWKRLDLLNAEEYALLYLESIGGPGNTALSIIDVEDKRSWIQDALRGDIGSTDWQEEVLRPGAIQSHDLSIRGGKEKLKYKLGGNFFDQQGIVENTYGKRYLGQADLQYQPMEALIISGNLKYSLNDYINYNQSSYSSILGTALRKDPINPVRDEITGNWDRTGLTDLPNPARMAYEQQFQKSKSIRVQPTLSASYQILDGLILKSTAMMDDRVINSENQRLPNVTVQSRLLDTDGQPTISPNESFSGHNLTKNKNTLQVLQHTNTLSFNRKFGAHSINTVFGFETYQEETTYNSDQIYFEPDSVGNLAYNERRYTLMSYFARAVYSYANKYLLTATLRRDGSSKFPEEGRWGTFPSFSVGWNIDNESFFPTNSIVTGVKLRGGWGQVGNQGPIAPYSFRSTLSPNWSYAFDNMTPFEGYAATRLPASTISWEVSEMTNVGLDLLMLDDRLSVTAEYYVKNTNDLLVNASSMPVPVFAGAQAPSSNAASMKNKGTELSLRYSQVLGDFNFSVGGNISFVQNNVTALGAGERIEGANYEPKIGMPVTRTVVGEAFATYYGLKTLGIFQTSDEIKNHLAVNEEGQPINADGQVVAQGSADQALIQKNAQPGDVIYQDTNKDGKIDSEDAVALGSAIPDYSYGFYLNAGYKSFDLSISFTGIQGNELANVFSYYIRGSSALDNNMIASRLGRWTGPGSSDSQPRVTQQNTQNDLFSDRYIEDGSFLRLRNIQLGYILPRDLISKLKMTEIRFYLSADNLLTFTDYSGLDPEIGLAYGDSFGPGVDLGTYPQARTIILGANIKF